MKKPWPQTGFCSDRKVQSAADILSFAGRGDVDGIFLG